MKVIGLDPELLFRQLSKYKVDVNKMPRFSNVFDRAEPSHPAIRMTVAGQALCEHGSMTFARIDGRSVISLQFNPYFDVDDAKKRELDQAIKEIADQREKQRAGKQQQEQANIKKAWLTIVKRDIPKAFKQYQKYKTDMENNVKKQS